MVPFCFGLSPAISPNLLPGTVASGWAGTRRAACRRERPCVSSLQLRSRQDRHSHPGAHAAGRAGEPHTEGRQVHPQEDQAQGAFLQQPAAFHNCENFHSLSIFACSLSTLGVDDAVTPAD